MDMILFVVLNLYFGKSFNIYTESFAICQLARSAHMYTEVLIFLMRQTFSVKFLDHLCGNTFHNLFPKWPTCMHFANRE